MPETARVDIAAPLPIRTTIAGPVTTKKLQRTLYVYLLVASAGVTLAASAESAAWKAFGLGLVGPGGGLWYVASPGLAMAACATVIFVGGMTWILSGALFVWPLLWLSAAILAAHHGYEHAHHGDLWPAAQWAVPAAYGLFLACCIAIRRVSWLIGGRRTLSVNAHLAAIMLKRSHSGTFTDVRPSELDDTDLAFVRYLLDLTLQPRDSFDGFDMIEQFQTSAIRYQLTAVQTALAAYQSAHVPAFSGYLTEAQRAAIIKMTHPRVWRYWFWENLIGNFRVNHDPIIRDNIMFSGYLATMLGTHRLTTEDTIFDSEGSLTFRTRGRELRYDHRLIVQAVYDNMARNAFCLYPCEPNFIYPVCNAIGLAGIAAYDRSHQTALAETLLPRFRQAWDTEFLAYSGRPLLLRSSRLGLTLPTLRMATNDAVIAAALRPVLPDIAYRTWEVMRDQAIDLSGDEPKISMAPWERVDPGRYRLTSMTTYATLAAAASAMGDTELCNAMLRVIEEASQPVLHDGAACIPTLSVLTNAAYATARLHRPNPAAADTSSPRLAEVAYPDVLVVKAVSHENQLSLILQPGNSPKPHTKIRFDRLEPGRRYLLTRDTLQQELTANQIGEAVTTIALRQRSRLTLSPAT
ncbi:linalool dehydratase/isomerase domain-containing protein [Mycobacteroides abscessus]|uniref:Membrane protein n=2 Tax=Mycobacteroides abscessus TaxID=36809 RepID=A0AB33AHE7_9MYCO|nr:hypothetical protein [Mycobacteroides abscessus]AGM31096.1 putative membrane protein [Mycobacteroides abscessus subsp. bolletii 50594]